MPITARFVRVWMTESSNTCDVHGSDDVRNCVGYGIQDFKAGMIDAGGAFSRQSTAEAGYTTSSIDPWHSATDVNATGSGQHTGFDVFFTSGLTNNLPAMIPVTMLYGTPDDSAAQIAYIKKRGYPIGWIEMGEEPDGKHILPEDYAALYIQWAKAIHKVDPALKLGGPVFEGINDDIKVWPDAQGRTSWIGRFIAYLKSHGHMSDLAFVSLEHYPFEPCSITWKSLYREPQMMKHVLDALRENGVPKDVPIMVTESHISLAPDGPDEHHLRRALAGRQYRLVFRRRRRGLLPLADSAAAGAGYLPGPGVVVELRRRPRLQHHRIHVALLEPPA